MTKLAAIAMGFSGSPPPYLSLMATTAANSSRSSSEVTRNTTMAAAAAYMSGANFASAGSGLLDSTVCLSLLYICFHLASNSFVFWFGTYKSCFNLELLCSQRTATNQHKLNLSISEQGSQVRIMLQFLTRQISQLA